MFIRSVVAAFLLLGLTQGAYAGPEKPFSRDRAARIIANVREVLSPQGLQRLEKVRIGGIDQWVSIRGRDRRNPVLLVIHGGPGYVLMPMSWWSFRDLEEYFTVVQWDQRGAGKTYLLNDPKMVGPTLTLERTVRDAEEMTAWLRKELGKHKIFIMGHSAGTYDGLEMARRHPDELYAYIGVGQMANMPESERRGWAWAMDQAKRTQNARALKELQAVAPYFTPGHPNPNKDVFVQRKWINEFGGTMAYRKNNDADSDLGELSPDYTNAELPKIWSGNSFTEGYLLHDLLSHDWSTFRKFDCPIIIFGGRHDHVVDSQLTADWFAEVQAPSKHFVWFEDSGHMPMTEEPAKFFLAMLRYARPIAEHAGDAAPIGP